MKSNENNKEVFSIQAVPILKTGKITDMYGTNVVFTIDDLDEIVKNTNALLKAKIIEPPLKLGHNEKQQLTEMDGMPAIGYISQVYRLGNEIFADFVNVPSKIYKLISNKAYSKISAEVYLEFKHPETQENIGKTLRAVALLGADLPAIKGLGDIMSLYNFEDCKLNILCFSEKDLKSKDKIIQEDMMNKMKLDDIKIMIKCPGCIKFIEDKMKKDNVKEIDTLQLAKYLTEMRLMKLESDLGQEQKQEQPEGIKCPEGYEWNGTECVSKNTEVVDNGHICPQGYQWNEDQKKCVPIEIKETEKDMKFEIPKDELKKIQDENKDKIKDFKFENDKRPPKGWWDECMAGVKDVTDTPEQLCGWIYSHPPEKKQEIESTRQEEVKKESENKDLKMSEKELKLQELENKVKELTLKEYKAKIDDLKKQNRDILIPALDEHIDNMFSYFAENDKVIKFKNKDISLLDYFVKFVNDFVKAKSVILSEVAKNDRSEIDLNNDVASGDGNIAIRNSKLSELVKQIKEKDNISYEEAFTKVQKMLKK